jgi:glucose/arabinose dehydrogenase
MLLAAAVLGGGSRSAFGQLRAELVASGLVNPIAFAQDPSNPGVQLIAQIDGHIRVLQSGTLLSGDFLDLSGAISTGGERGLLGLALAPDYGSSGRLYVNFTNQAGHTVVARFTRSTSNPLRADPASRFDLVWPGGQAFITQPFENHNGGNLAFGPDGYLYIGMGDGGAGDDPFNNAQNPATLLGKMLRIDVNVADSHPTGYVVPPTNPFVGRGDVLGEIWAFGLRNPWRWSFDPPAHGGTGALIIGDVGQGSWEEVDYEPAGHGGRNYGWRIREGAHDEVTSLPPFSLPLRDPTFEYSHDVGKTVIGGQVYRGTNLASAYFGRYFFADFVNARIWSLRFAVDPNTGEASATDLIDHTSELGAGNIVPASFGTDASGNVYMLDYGAGRIFRIASGTGAPPPSSGGGCTTPDPFASLGGGTCVNGGWLPPGVAPPSGAPPPPPPSSSSGCTTPDPFVSIGGGTCVNGGWVPGFVSAPSAPPPPPPPPPSSPTGCTTPDPFATLGGGTCVNGGWLPPGIAPPSSSTPPPPPPPPSAGCTIPDPFISIPGYHGVCVNGGWIPVANGG